MQMITTDDGKLISGILDGASIPALESFRYRQLVALGELCIGRHELVNQLMATMAQAMNMGTEDLIRQSWFQKVGVKAQVRTRGPARERQSLVMHRQVVIL